MWPFNKTVDLDVAGVRLEEEDKLFGLFDFPSNPGWHKFFLLFLGALVLVADVYFQLPSVITEESIKDTTIDPSIWLSLPFIVFAIIIDNKQLLKRICTNFRKIALEDGYELQEFQLRMLVDKTLQHLILLRILGGVRIFAGWFLLFNLMLVGLFLYLGL